MTKEDKIKELKIQRMNLISEASDRYAPEVITEEKRILQEIEKLVNEK